MCSHVALIDAGVMATWDSSFAGCRERTAVALVWFIAVDRGRYNPRSGSNILLGLFCWLVSLAGLEGRLPIIGLLATPRLR